MKTKYIPIILATFFCLTSFAQSASTPPLMSDAQILSVVTTANDGEIDLASHAKSNAKATVVKDFASMLYSDHKANNKESKDLASKIKVKPENNEMSDSLKRTAKSEMNILKDTKNDAYDRAYIESQVKMHRTVLTSLDDSLIPNATNAELKAMLQKTRTKISQHLERAKEIATSLQ